MWIQILVCIALACVILFLLNLAAQCHEEWQLLRHESRANYPRTPEARRALTVECALAAGFVQGHIDAEMSALERASRFAFNILQQHGLVRDESECEAA